MIERMSKMSYTSMRIHLAVLILISSGTAGLTQLEWNGNVDFGYVHGQETSHYFFNGIHKDNRENRTGFEDITLMLAYHFAGDWTLRFQGSLQRELGNEFGEFNLRQLHISYNPEGSAWAAELGRVLHPFGSFYQRQLSQDRWLYEAPLAYSYFVNISSRIGHSSSLGDRGFQIGDLVEWGQSTLYRYGYLTGGKVVWNSKDGKRRWDLAFGDNYEINEDLFAQPLKWQIVSRYGWQLNWFWKQGLSVRYASFLQESAVSQEIVDLTHFREVQLGTDFELGFSFLEFKGEVILSHYSVPVHDRLDGYNIVDGSLENESLYSMAAYVDVKYEWPFLNGMFSTYRIETLQFGDLNGTSWDYDVWRHSVLLGYKITRYAMIRLQYSTQTTDSKDWNLDAFRGVITLHF